MKIHYCRIVIVIVVLVVIIIMYTQILTIQIPLHSEITQSDIHTINGC
jgi:hypothetical protein